MKLMKSLRTKRDGIAREANVRQCQSYFNGENDLCLSRAVQNSISIRDSERRGGKTNKCLQSRDRKSLKECPSSKCGSRYQVEVRTNVSIVNETRRGV